MQALLALVAVIGAGAGNVRGQPGGSVNVNLYPAIAAANYPNIVVFGSVDTCGEEASDSQQGPLVSVWAPGVDVECAANVDRGSQQETGTSYAASMVSGLHGSEPCAISGTGHSAHSGRCQGPHHGRSLTSRETRGGSRGGVSSGGFERLGVSPLKILRYAGAIPLAETRVLGCYCPQF